MISRGGSAAKIREVQMIGKIWKWMTVSVVLTLSSNAYGAEPTTIFHATLGESGKTPEISTQQMRATLNDNAAFILDTRTRAEFDAGHIPGARNLGTDPAAAVAAVESLTGGNKAAALILYCNGPYCQASRRLGEQLSNAGFGNVQRYQLGIPVWRALGGPVEIELAGVARVFKADQSAVYIDARAAEEFAAGSLPGAISAPVEDVLSGKLKKIALPEDDFNRRIILFGIDRAQARKLADFMGKRPWHNVSYFGGRYDALAAALK